MPPVVSGRRGRYNVTVMVSTRARGSLVTGDNDGGGPGQGRCRCVIPAGGIARIHRRHGAAPHSRSDGVLGPQLGRMAGVSVCCGRDGLCFQSGFSHQARFVGRSVVDIGMVTRVWRTAGRVVRIVGSTELHGAGGGPHRIDHTRSAGRHGSVTRSGTHPEPLQLLQINNGLRSAISDRGSVGLEQRKSFNRSSAGGSKAELAVRVEKKSERGLG